MNLILKTSCDLPHFEHAYLTSKFLKMGFFENKLFVLAQSPTSRHYFEHVKKLEKIEKLKKKYYKLSFYFYKN